MERRLILLRKRIQTYFLAAILFTMIFVLMASIIYMSNQQINATRQSLKNTMNVLLTFDQEKKQEIDLVEYGQKVNDTIRVGIRVTVLGREGTVYYDSENEIDSMESHGQRKELVDAVAVGYGEDIRRSATSGQRTIYVCRPITEEFYIRFAAPVSIAYEFIGQVLPLILLFCFLLMVVGYVVAKRLSMRLTEPFHELSASLDRLITGKGRSDFENVKHTAEYDELAPIIQNIHQLNARLEKYIGRLQEKSREIENILSAVDDGIIMMNQKMDILIINQKANRLFPTNGNFKTSCRNEELLQKIQETIRTGEPSFLNTEIVSRPGETYRCLISPARNQDDVVGVVISISNITEIKKLENVRREFVSNFSHEMKSPLTSIKGFAELLKNDMVDDPEKIKEYLTIIITESTRMVHVINDMLKLSEIETQQKSTLQIEKVELQPVVENIKNVLTFQADALNISVEVEGEASIWSDKGKVSEIILNIMDNALKYNKLNGEVKVKLWEENNMAYISVRDSGVGIPPESIDRVFERFYRVDKARSRKSGSTGLGLSIVKHDVELLGGSIKAVSEEGSFTEMLIKLPIHAEMF